MNTLSDTLKSELRPLAGITIGLLLITALAYPLAITGIGQALFNRQANGSIIEVDGQAVGSSLLGQAFTSDRYFWGRPSAAGDGYDASDSGGSNLGPTSAALLNRVESAAAAFRAANGLAAGAELPADAVSASASGLDPHISPATARLQVARVAAARGASQAAIREVVDEHTEDPFLGFIGKPRVNVLEVNIALDQRYPVPE